MDKVSNEHEHALNEEERIKQNRTGTHDLRSLLVDNKKLIADKQALLDREKKQIEQIQKLKDFEQEMITKMNMIR